MTVEGSLMSGLVVRGDRGNLSVTFNLSTFITDWEGARKEFVAGIAENFRELLNPQPGDFSADPSSELGEAWCKYRIFGGSSTIILRADNVSLSFVNILRADLDIIADVVGGTMERLLPRLRCYERQSYTIFSNYHAHVIEGDWQGYLEHHGSTGIGAVAGSESALEYRPIVGFTLRTSDGSRVFRRTIEQSELVPNGVFISDNSYISLPGLTGMDEELSWREQAVQFANHASGIVHEGNEQTDD